MKVGLIDYGMGNLFSVQNALTEAGAEVKTILNPDDFSAVDAVVLPGVGAFGEAMEHLSQSGVGEKTREFIASGKPFLGICLGFQLLFSSSEEFGHTKGLGVIDGEILRLPGTHDGFRLKVPQISWHGIEVADSQLGRGVLTGVKNHEYMYFVHSFYAKPKSEADVLTATNYAGFRFCSGVKRDNVVGFQFHPEKSGIEGLKIYRNFVCQVR